MPSGVPDNSAQKKTTKRNKAHKETKHVKSELVMRHAAFLNTSIYNSN